MAVKRHGILVVAVTQVISIILLAISLALSPVFIVYRYLLGLYLERKYKQPIEFLRGLDAVFGMCDKKVPFNVISFHIFQGNCDIEKLRQRINERWLQQCKIDGRWKHIRYRQQVKQELGHLFWILPQTEFQIENHVREYDGPPLTSKDDLQKFVAWEYENLLGKGIYWEILLVHLPDTFWIDKPQPQFMLFTGINHILCDGVSGARMYKKLFDEELETVFPSHRGALRVNLLERLSFWRNVFLRGLADYHLRLFTRENHFLHSCSLTGDVFASISEPLSLKKVKEIKKFYKTSVNEVLMSCVVGAIRRHFVAEGQEIPSLLKIQVPLSFHGFKKEATPLNDSSAGVIEAAVDEPTVVGRLLRTKAAVDELKTSPNVFLNYLLGTIFTNRIPMIFISEAFRRITSTAVVSCVPIILPEKILGNRALKPMICFAPPIGFVGCGVAIQITSSRDTIMTTLVAFSSVLKSQESVDRIISYFAMEIDELYRTIKCE